MQPKRKLSVLPLSRRSAEGGFPLPLILFLDSHGEPLSVGVLPDNYARGHSDIMLDYPSLPGPIMEDICELTDQGVKLSLLYGGEFLHSKAD